MLRVRYVHETVFDQYSKFLTGAFHPNKSYSHSLFCLDPFNALSNKILSWYASEAKFRFHPCLDNIVWEPLVRPYPCFLSTFSEFSLSSAPANFLFLDLLIPFLLLTPFTWKFGLAEDLLLHAYC